MIPADTKRGTRIFVVDADRVIDREVGDIAIYGLNPPYGVYRQADCFLTRDEAVEYCVAKLEQRIRELRGTR